MGSRVKAQRTGRRALSVSLVIALVLLAVAVRVPRSATAAPPSIPACGPEVTDVPLTDANDLVAVCTGSRLGPFSAPSVSSVALNEVGTVDWPAVRCNDTTSILQYVCVTMWDFELQFYEPGPGGEPHLLNVLDLEARGIHADFGFSGAEEKCQPIMVGIPGGTPGKCQFLITSDGPVFTGDITVLMRATARRTDCVDALFDGYCESVGFNALGGLPWWMGVTSLGGGAPAGDPPAASFAAEEHAPGSLQWDFDASASAAFGGATIEQYDWDFGDDETGSGTVVQHPYAAPGTYPVTLTVHDSNGLTDSVTQEVEVADPGLVVNSVADTPNDADAGEQCDTGNLVGDAPECTLRAAIEAANTAAKAQPISFAVDVVGTPQITVSSALPELTAPATIDGSTQPGGAVEVYSPTATFNGIHVNSDATVKGLTLRGFATAILAEGDGITVQDNRIGTDPAGTHVTAAPHTGILMGAGAGIDIRGNVVTATSYGMLSIQQGGGTIRDNRIGTDASGEAALATRPSIGLRLFESRPWSVTGNIVTGSEAGIILHGASETGTVLSGNGVGISASGTTFLGSAGVGILVDGVSGVTVAENAVAARSGLNSIDIAVTGIPQYVDGLTGPGAERSGTPTGADVTVSDNHVGVLGASTAVGGRFGIVAWAQAARVHITGNHVAGHDHPLSGDGALPSAEILVAGTTGVEVAGNVVGTNLGATAAVGGDAGIVVQGAGDTTVDANLVAGVEEYALLVGDYAATESGALQPSARTVLTSNGVGVNGAGTGTIANGDVGIAVKGASTDTEVVGNLVSGSTGVAVVVADRAAKTAVGFNRIGTNASATLALGNRVGIDVRDQAEDTTLVANTVGGSTDQGILTQATNPTQVFKNDVGRSGGAASLPNRVGVEMRAPGSVLENRVWFNHEQGILIGPGIPARINANSTFGNGGLGIAGPIVPTAPVLDVVHVTFGTESRTWFVVATPATAAGVVEVFANPDCSDGNEGRTLVRTTSVPVPGHQVLIPIDPLPPGGFTATVTDGSPARTSVYSNCALPSAYPDTSGTGIPDIVQEALLGDPSEPNRVVFPGDHGGRITLSTNAGTFRNVRPVSQPDGAENLAFPAGVFSFEVVGLTPGQPVTVIVGIDKGAAQYWRYGRMPGGTGTGWYAWDLDPATGLGARPLTPDATGLAKTWELSFQDGKPGDDDGVANGTIVDPGGAANGTGPTTVADESTVHPPVVLQPAFTG